MADDRSRYTVEIDGMKHTMLLNSRDAKRYGQRATPAGKSASNKAATASTK